MNLFCKLIERVIKTQGLKGEWERLSPPALSSAPSSGGVGGRLREAIRERGKR